MSQEPLENLLSRSGGSVYRLTRMAAKRALEISDGQPPLINKPVSDKATSIALEEILEGKIEARQVNKGVCPPAAQPESE